MVLASWLAIMAAGVLAPLAYLHGVAPAVSAGNLSVHVHDDYYHPPGAFAVNGVTSHPTAKATCESANPPPACDAVIRVGDSITWVAPAPLAVNPHTVTECTDGTFTTCGAGVAAGNPIEDSGLRAPPSPGPSGWPYGPIQFSDPGTYYYICVIHPDVMRGRVVVLANPSVGGVTEFDGGTHTSHASAPDAVESGGSMSAGVLAAIAAVGLAATGVASLAWVRVRSLR
jgi:plastocyanin